MTKHDDLYTCEHCGRYVNNDRVNGKQGSVRYECTCGRMLNRRPHIPAGYRNTCSPPEP